MTPDISPPGASRDRAMIGAARYARNPLDFYPTPARATEAFASVFEEDMEGYAAWEPFCGAGHISKVVAPLCRVHGSTDIRAYDGFDPHGLIDFFAIRPDGEAFEIAQAAHHADEDAAQAAVDEGLPRPVVGSPPVSMQEVADLLGFRPDAIITNPPYDEKEQGVDAEMSVRHALTLMEPERGVVAMLLRHEWDCAKKRADLFDHPAFAFKVTLRFRPRWIEDSTGAPRHSYAWFVWDFTKPAAARPELIYAG